MKFRDIFLLVSPKISSKIISAQLALSVTAVGFKCFAVFSDAKEPDSDNEPRDEVTETIVPSEETEKKHVFFIDNPSQIGTAINGVSGVFVSMNDKRIIAEKNMNTSVNAGDISVGKPADVVIFDDKNNYHVQKFESKAENSPFLGALLYGKVKYTICVGRIVYQG